MLIPTARSAFGGEFGTANAIGTANGVDLLERSDVAALLISACVDGEAAGISAIIGIDLPLKPGQVFRSGGMTAIWLSPRSWIVQCAIDDEARLQSAVADAFPDGRWHATGFTDHLCWLELCGDNSMQLLCRGAFVSLDSEGLPVGRSKRTLVADVAVVILRVDALRLLVGVERSRARYFRDWLLSD